MSTNISKGLTVYHDDRIDNLEGDLIEIPCEGSISELLISKGFSPIFNESRRDETCISDYFVWEKGSDVIYSYTHRGDKGVTSRLKVPRHLSRILDKEPLVIDFVKSVEPGYFKSIGVVLK